MQSKNPDNSSKITWRNNSVKELIITYNINTKPNPKCNYYLTPILANTECIDVNLDINK